MSLVIKINTVDRSSYIEWETVQYTEVLTKEVDTLQFIIKKLSGRSMPDILDDVILLENGVKLFGGVIIEMHDAVIGGKLVGVQFSCKDYSHTLDKQLVVQTYENMMAGEIIQDIIDNYTTGFTYTNIPAVTPDITTIKFNYEPVTRAIGKIAAMVGWDWYVDPDKDIHFLDYTTVAAPFDITDSGGKFIWESLEFHEDVINLKNSIYVRGGERKLTLTLATAIDKYLGDGTKKAFSLAYRYDNITVEKQGVAQTVGIDNITDPATVDVLYNFQEKFIRFVSAPANGNTVNIYGDAFIPILANVQDDASVALYGEYQDIIIDKSITSVNEAILRATSELEKYSDNRYDASFRTLETGLHTGQKIRINSSVRGVDRYYNIKRIEAAPKTHATFEYKVYLQVTDSVTFVDMMLALLSKDRVNLDIDPNEILQTIKSTTADTLSFVDTMLTTLTGHGPYKYGVDADAGVWNFATWG